MQVVKLFYIRLNFIHLRLTDDVIVCEGNGVFVMTLNRRIAHYCDVTFSTILDVPNHVVLIHILNREKIKKINMDFQVIGDIIIREAGMEANQKRKADVDTFICESRTCWDSCPWKKRSPQGIFTHVPCVEYPTLLEHSNSVHRGIIYLFKIISDSIGPKSYVVSINFRGDHTAGSRFDVYNETSLGRFYFVKIETNTSMSRETLVTAFEPTISIQLHRYIALYELEVYPLINHSSLCPSNSSTWRQIHPDIITLKLYIWTPSPWRQTYTFKSRPGYYINLTAVDWKVSAEQRLSVECSLWNVMLDAVDRSCRWFRRYPVMCHRYLKGTNIVVPYRYLIIQTFSHLKYAFKDDFYTLALSETPCMHHVLCTYLGTKYMSDAMRGKHGLFHYNASLYLIQQKCAVVKIFPGNKCIWYTPWCTPDVASPTSCCTKFEMSSEVVASTMEVIANMDNDCHQEIVIFEEYDKVLYRLSFGYHHFDVPITSGSVFVLLRGEICFLSKLYMKFSTVDNNHSSHPVTFTPDYYVITSELSNVFVRNIKTSNTFFRYDADLIANKFRQYLFLQNVNLSDAQMVHALMDMFPLFSTRISNVGKCDLHVIVQNKNYNFKLLQMSNVIISLIQLEENIQLSIRAINVGNSSCKWIMKHNVFHSETAKTNIIKSFLYDEKFNITDYWHVRCPQGFINIDNYCLSLLIGDNHSWLQFEDSCGRMNSTLASVNTKYKLQVVNKFLDASGYTEHKDHTEEFTHIGLKRDEHVSIWSEMFGYR